jgi:glycerol-3-phosphate dehydrogenase
MPIAEQVHAILFEGKSPSEGVADLMARAPAREMEGLVDEPS